MEWLPLATTVVIACATPILAWWGSTRYFDGRFEEWKRASEEWRIRTDKRLDELNIAHRAATDENVRLRLSRLEEEVDKLREWKHLRVEPLLGRIGPIDQRLERLEGWKKSAQE